MNEFSFYMPTKIVYAKGSLKMVADYAREYGKKGLLITDKMMMETPIIESVRKSLEEAGLDYMVWSEIVPNPRDVDIEKGAEFVIKNKIDYLIAVGGGSAIDTAKAMGAIMTNGGTCADLYGDKLTVPIAPLIAVPTTCGTGSEVTHESIVNNTVTLVKDCIWGPNNSTKVAILDPDVLIKLPPHIMASTGMDALCFLWSSSRTSSTLRPRPSGKICSASSTGWLSLFSSAIPILQKCQLAEFR